MRDYRHIEAYLSDLVPDVYAQPPDDKHNALTHEVIQHWVALLELESALDVGCGQGHALAMLAEYAERVEGVTLGDDYDVCQAQGMPVQKADMSFLPYDDGEFDLVFARHALEHSPMPLLTLMEWQRVSRKWLVLVVPSLTSFGWYGRNHYYVLLPQQWTGLIERAGWEIILSEDSTDEFEHRFFCEVDNARNPESFRTHPKDA